ncbi:hypothetical protein A5780_10400 [Nocardia sp. 852002-20019_SCH5090214]|nr:hypothetical protein A5780_10400 [Nocardia sp. 852002-20019_SCH5090214]
MVGCFAIRKLLDTPGKLSDECRSELVSVVAYPVARAAPDFWDAYQFWDFYDLEQEQSKPERIGLRDLCNRVIHSLVFGFEGSEHAGSRLSGIFVASDVTSKKSLTSISIPELARVFRVVADDQVVSLQMVRDAQGRNKVVRASRNLSDAEKAVAARFELRNRRA